MTLAFPLSRFRSPAPLPEPAQLRDQGKPATGSAAALMPTQMRGTTIASSTRRGLPMKWAATSAPAAEQEEIEHASLDRDYWLEHCEGYKVASPVRALGVVEEVIPPADDRPRLLAVRGGLLGRRRMLVPTSDVAVVVPRAMRLFLRSTRARR
jgi:hypothetical protein